jgi:sugar phosphate isomerase/epimerase
MRFLSLAALTVLELTPEEQIICAQECGYQGVGLRLIPATPQEKHYSLLNNKTGLQKVKAALAATDIKVLDIEIFRIKPDIPLESYEAYLEMGAELGARNMLVAGNDPDRKRLSEQWEKLCQMAKPYNIRPHIEPMPWTDVKGYLDGIHLVESGPELGGLLIDPIHFFRANGACSQIQTKHIKRMSYIQLADAPAQQPDTMDEILRQAREDRLPPSAGGFPLADLMHQLPDDLPISTEIPLAPRWGCKTEKEKAQLALDHTTRFLQKIYASK